MKQNSVSVNISHRSVEPRNGQNKKCTDFSTFFHKHMKMCRYDNQRINTRLVAEKLGISYELFRKKVGGQKPITKRDLVIAICMVLKLDEDETNMALRMHTMLELKTGSQHFEEEYITIVDQRDIILSNFLEGSFSCIDDVNNMLALNELALLDLNDTRLHALQENPKLRFRIAKKDVSCDADYLLFSPDTSLESVYSPGRYAISARMWVEEIDTSERFELSMTNNDSKSIMHYTTRGVEWMPKGIDNEEKFRDCFTDLQHMIDNEMRRMMAVVNDTKNYRSRSSARLIGGKVHVFYEGFNYAVPEWNEYFWMEYCNGEYSFSVQKKSIFLWKQLGDMAYRKYVGQPPEEAAPLFTFFSETEDMWKVDAQNKHHVERLIHRIQQNAMKRAKAEIDALLEKLRRRELFIRNINDQCPTPLAPLWFYKVLDLFECTCDPDDEYEIAPGRQCVEYPLKDNHTVELTVDDVLRGYELGFDSVDEIAEVKAKNGTLEKVF